MTEPKNKKVWCIEVEYEKDKDFHITTRRTYFYEDDVFIIESKERGGVFGLLIVLRNGDRHNCTLGQLSEVETDSVLKLLKDKSLN